MNPQVALYYKASEVFTPEQLEELSNSGTITWGDADHTLVRYSRCRLYLSLKGNLSDDSLIDLEH